MWANFKLSGNDNKSSCPFHSRIFPLPPYAE